VSWRIPIPHEDGEFRRGALRVLLAATICLCVVFVFGGELRVWGLVSTVVVAATAFAFVYWRASHAVASRKDNVRLDADGLHWTNEHNGEGTLPRSEMETFEIGPDAETPDSLKSLTFQLGGSRVSQPVPLLLPATPQVVTEFLTSTLSLPRLERDIDGMRSHLFTEIERSLLEQPPGDATTFLQFAQLETPELLDDHWLVFQQHEFGKVFYQTESCEFKFEPCDGAPQTISTLKQLLLEALDFLEELSDARRVELLEAAADGLDHRFRESLRAQATRAGFYCECDDAGASWTFSGARQPLLNLVAVIRQVAAFQLAIPGELPPHVEIASHPMPVTVQLEEFAWFGGGVISGPSRRLLQLADSIEERIGKTATGGRCSVEPPNDAAEPWRLHFEVQPDDFSPATVASLDP